MRGVFLMALVIVRTPVTRPPKEARREVVGELHPRTERLGEVVVLDSSQVIKLTKEAAPLARHAVRGVNYFCRSCCLN